MRNYWYITSKHRYPGGNKNVKSTQMLSPAYSVIEMKVPATPSEIDNYQFEYLGHIKYAEVLIKLEKVKGKYVRDYELRIKGEPNES